MVFLREAFIFLLKIIFDLYFLAVLLRFLFQYFQVDFYNPFSQFILKITDPILVPLGNKLPHIRKIDIAALLLLFGLKAVEFLGLTLLIKKILPHILGVFIWSLGECISQTINFFFFAVLLVAILSWISPRSYTPFTSLLIQITEPLMAPARRLLPRTLGIDFSPIFVLIILKLADILIANPIIGLGIILSY
jgi:YggT family protein